MKKRQDYNNDLQRPIGSDYFALIILIIASAIVPLVVLMRPVKLEGILLQSWTGIEVISDFFSYNKSQLLIICMVMLIIYLGFSLFKKRIELSKIFLPLGIYVVMVILSTLLAEHKVVAVGGYVDRFEGLFALLAYCLLTVAAAIVLKNRRLSEISLIAIFVSITIIAILGLTQFYGVDLLQTPFGKRLILPKEYEHIADTLNFTFAGQKVMYTTVYNPNYLGSLSALLLPIALGLYYSWVEKGGWKIPLALLFTASSFVLFLGGMSRAGLLGGLFALIIFIVLFRKKIIKHILHTVLILGLICGIYIVMDLTSGGLITREVRATLPSGFLVQNDQVTPNDNKETRSKYVKDFHLIENGVIFETESEGLKIEYDQNDQSLSTKDLDGKTLTIVNASNRYQFSDTRYENYNIVVFINGVDLIWGEQLVQIRMQEGKLVFLNDNVYSNSFNAASIGAKQVTIDGRILTFVTEEETIKVIYGENGFTYADENGASLEKVLKESTYTFQDERYSLYNIIPINSGFYIMWNSHYLPFIIQDNKLTYMSKTNTFITQIQKPETFGFKGSELFASSRGYIWSRSIPMLKNTILVGHGPDTYAIYFPQHEIDAKMNYLDSSNIVVDKPHNWYLQMGINTGVISLIAMLVFLAWYWLKGFFLWMKDVTGIEKSIGASILCGVTGYCVAGVFNDSTVSVAPVFWVILGIGIAYVLKYTPNKHIEKI